MINIKTWQKNLKEKLWKVKIRVVPNVIGALGTIPKGLVGYLESIEVNHDAA